MLQFSKIDSLSVPSSLIFTIISNPVSVSSQTGGYSLAEPSEHFALDNATGVVTVKDRLDYERQPELSFVVVAHDTGVPTLSATTTVIVQVLKLPLKKSYSLTGLCHRRFFWRGFEETGGLTSSLEFCWWMESLG